MKKNISNSIRAFAVVMLAFFQSAATQAAEPRAHKPEIRSAISRGIAWLNDHQDAETGAWGDPEQPALTALAVSAIMGDPNRHDFVRRVTAAPPANVRKAYTFISSHARDDGGIYGKGLACYNTALCLRSLLLDDSGDFLDLVKGAKRFLVNQQSDFDVRGTADSKYDGGIGYGGTYAHSDLSNTHFVLEALYHTKTLFTDTENEVDLDWAAAIKFVERCQNLPETNDQEFASGDAKNKGGFVYYPGDSKAGKDTLPDGKVALRSYGSMSYAGLLSLIYADLEKDDVRVKAVLEWLQANYSIEENPGLGAQGLFYYYHSMAKALSICGIEKLKLKDGSEIDWCSDLAKKMLDLQDADGSWTNANGRWWEKDPILVTSYAVLTLEHLWQQGFELPEAP